MFFIFISQYLLKDEIGIGSMLKFKDIFKIVKEVFYGLEKISIDYAIMEKVSNRLVVKGYFSSGCGDFTTIQQVICYCLQ